MNTKTPTLNEVSEFEYFVQFIEQRTEDIRDYINARMKNDGDTEETSQRICILNAVNQLETVINGTTINDMAGN